MTLAEEKFKELLKVRYPPDEFIEGVIPVFKSRQKTEEDQQEQQNDKYDKDPKYVDMYTGLFAFAHIVLKTGGAEGLYRTINSAILSNLDRRAVNKILDVGCGVGRTLYDCTDEFTNPETLLVGMDFSYRMCIRAKEILVDGSRISLAESLAATGFGASRKLELTNTKKATNVFIAQGGVPDLPFKDESFDCVVNTNLIDRIDDPLTAIEDMVRVLRPRGLFILCDPLNFDNATAQETIPTKERLLEAIRDHGVEDTEWFDGLVYREVKDVRGNYEDFLTFVCIGRKK